MRKLLLLIATLSLVTVFAWSIDFYNHTVSIQADQCKADLQASMQPSTMADSNMRTSGQASNGRRPDFYNRELSAHVAELQAENEATRTAPTLLAGNNMITGGQSSSGGRDFYNEVLSAKVAEFQAENTSIGGGPTLLAGNNMITGEQVVFGPQEEAVPGDFYNRALSAQVGKYGVDNNAIAPSALEFAEPQTVGELPGSMAANIGERSESDWYQHKVAVQAELNRRAKKAETF